MSTGWRLIVALCLMLCVARLSSAESPRLYELNLPAQSVADALNGLSEQTGVPVVFSYDLAKDRKANPVVGRYTLEGALDELLRDTGISGGLSERGVVILTPSAPRMPSTRGETGVTYDSDQENINKDPNTSNKPASHRTAVAAFIASVVAAFSASAEEAAIDATDDQPKMASVVVTAEKREERQQDVPITMTVLDPQSLAENGQNRLVDYFASVPGLNLSSNAFYGGTSYLTIRGISAGNYQNSTVATVIDDVPIGSGNVLAEGMLSSPDLDPSDLARVEVLKGPQGTLYGADSLSGLIKYVTLDPSTSGFNARVEVGGSAIPGGGQGYVVRGAANVPLTETTAVRVSAFSRHDPGYIDNIYSGDKNFNSADVHGAHLAALWRPSEDFSLKLGALVQQAHGNSALVNYDGVNSFVSGDLNYTALPNSTAYSTEQQLYTANLDWKVAGLDVVSVTGFSVNGFGSWKDYTHWAGPFGCNSTPALFPSLCRVVAGFPATGIIGVPSEADFVTRKISEEVRVSSSIDKWLDWRLAGFYTHENTPSACQTHHAADPINGVIGGELFQFCGTTLNSTEYAFFGDFTVHITDRFDIELGGRESWYKQNYQDVDSGPATQVFDGAPSPFVGPLQHIDGSAFTYQVTPRLKLSQDLMLYARVASGYRIGGPNATAFILQNQGLGIPKSYAPDRTTNYELGIKAEAFDHLLTFDAAAYYVAWKNFQINVQATQFTGFTANAGDAKSAGVEFSLEVHPLPGLTISAVGSYDDAVLTQDLPAAATAYGKKGDELPYSMKYSAGLTVNQDVHFSHDWVGFVGAAANYIGSRAYEFTNPTPGAAPGAAPSSPRLSFPGYTQVNLRGGVHYGSWLANLYINNVGDKRGIAGIIQSQSIVAPGGYNASVIQPRTVGLDVSKTF